jgi:hypothetical protein
MKTWAALLACACSSPFETATHAGDASPETLPDRAAFRVAPETGKDNNATTDPREARADSDPHADGGASVEAGREVWPLERDASTPKDASNDTDEIPALPPDAGETSRSFDASSDAEADAEADAEPPDVLELPPTCAERYADVPGFALCEDAGSTCEFVTTNTATACASICDGSCGVSWQSSGTCGHGSAFACSLSLSGASHQICRCSP